MASRCGSPIRPGSPFDKAFTISVGNVNEAPVDATMSGGSVRRNSDNGTVVGTVTGVDPDAGAGLTYSLTDNPLGRFAINASTGVLTVANHLFIQTPGSYGITVRVTDQGGLTFDKAFAINVTQPVILDLNGNGVELVPRSLSQARFDMDGDGVRDATAWAGAGDGLLAIDLGAGGAAGPDGVIDQTKEIVFTQWAPGTTSDMAALRQVFDTNHNGKLDTGDARWSEFRVWQDGNQDGVSQAGELRTLDQVGIRSIDLTPSGPAVHFPDGSAITGTSTYTRADGSTGIAGDAAFAYSDPRVHPDADGSVARLVQALATYSASHPGFDAAAAAQPPNNAAMQGAIAAAWH